MSISSAKQIQKRTLEFCKTINRWYLTKELFDNINKIRNTEYRKIPERERIGKGIKFISNQVAKGYIIGIGYYLFMVADRHSIILTLAGLKFFAILLVGIFIWIINNVSFLSSPFQGFITIFKDVLLRILIFICIFSLGTVFLDVFPLKELVYFFVKKINKGEVAIDIGIGQIIELKKSKTKIIYYTNISIGIIQIFSSIFIFILIYLFAFEVISINEIIFGNTVVPHKTSEFIFFTILIFTGTVLLVSGPFKLYLSRETKTLGI